MAPTTGMGLAAAALLLMTSSVGQAVGTVMLLVVLRVAEELVGEAERVPLFDWTEEVGVTASAVEEVTRVLEGVGWTAEVKTEDVKGCALVIGDCTVEVGLA